MKSDKNINGTEQDEMKIVLPLNEAEETGMRNAKKDSSDGRYVNCRKTGAYYNGL